MEQIFPIGLYLVTPIRAKREAFTGVTAGSVESGQAASAAGVGTPRVLRVARAAEAPPLRRQPGGGVAVSQETPV